MIEELPGILNWALSGLEDYFEIGLKFPEEIRNAVKEYRSEFDIIGSFINESCQVSEESSCKGKELYDAYTKWCQENGENHISNRIFASQLRERGFEDKKRSDAKYWQKIELLNG